MAIHVELEQRLAEFKKTEAVVVFQSGFAANAGTVSAVLDKDDIVVSDELNHASIIDGCRLSRADHQGVSAQGRRRGPQDPAVAAGRRSARCSSRTASSAWTATSARCPILCSLAEEFGCIMMVDDAHASGVFGANGRGTIDHFGMHGRVDIQVGTLSKAIGVLGGYVAGTRALIEFLHHRARPFLFSTSHPPAVAAACIAALDVLMRRAADHRPALGEHAVLQSRAERARLRHGRQREPDHARDRRRRRAGDEIVRSTVRLGRIRAGDCVSDGRRATRRACEPS